MVVGCGLDCWNCGLERGRGNEITLVTGRGSSQSWALFRALTAAANGETDMFLKVMAQKRHRSGLFISFVRPCVSSEWDGLRCSLAKTDGSKDKISLAAKFFFFPYVFDITVS